MTAAERQQLFDLGSGFDGFDEGLPPSYEGMTRSDVAQTRAGMLDPMPQPPDWPFDQAPNVGAVTVQAVLDVVAHDADDHGWQFLDGREPNTDLGRVIGMGTALSLDPSLRLVADLPPGWIAWRSRVGDPWSREVNPRPDEGDE